MKFTLMLFALLLVAGCGAAPRTFVVRQPAPQASELRSVVSFTVADFELPKRIINADEADEARYRVQWPSEMADSFCETLNDVARGNDLELIATRKASQNVLKLKLTSLDAGSGAFSSLSMSGEATLVRDGKTVAVWDFAISGSSSVGGPPVKHWSAKLGDHFAQWLAEQK